MNKNDLVRAIANDAGITLKDAGIALDSVVAAITDGLKKGEKISLLLAPAFKANYPDRYDRILGGL